MDINEVEVHISSNRRVRAAIVARSDGLYCIFVHQKISNDELRALNAISNGGPDTVTSYGFDHAKRCEQNVGHLSPRVSGSLRRTCRWNIMDKDTRNELVV